MATQAKSEVVHIRIPSDLMKTIKAAADAEDRTHSQQIIRCLKEWIGFQGTKFGKAK